MSSRLQFVFIGTDATTTIRFAAAGSGLFVLASVAHLLWTILIPNSEFSRHMGAIGLWAAVVALGHSHNSARLHKRRTRDLLGTGSRTTSARNPNCDRHRCLQRTLVPRTGRVGSGRSILVWSSTRYCRIRQWDGSPQYRPVVQVPRDDADAESSARVGDSRCHNQNRVSGYGYCHLAKTLHTVTTVRTIPSNQPRASRDIAVEAWDCQRIRCSCGTMAT